MSNVDQPDQPEEGQQPNTDPSGSQPNVPAPPPDGGEDDGDADGSA